MTTLSEKIIKPKQGIIVSGSDILSIWLRHDLATFKK